MSELDDDIAHGCLKNGEPIEARWGSGWWSEQQEPEREQQMKTFLICPVRGHTQEETEQIVAMLESEGYDVHWPPRDTDQNDPNGLRICQDNCKAIKNADVVHFIWNGESQGCLFDLGMAFAFNKPIIPISMPPLTEYKSFQNMVTEWANR